MIARLAMILLFYEITRLYCVVVETYILNNNNVSTTEENGCSRLGEKDTCFASTI